MNWDVLLLKTKPKENINWKKTKLAQGKISVAIRSRPHEDTFREEEIKMKMCLMVSGGIYKICVSFISATLKVLRLLPTLLQQN